MKDIKRLGLLCVLAALLLAFASTASATKLTSDDGETPTINATSSSAEFDGAFVTVKCEHSELDAKIDSHGSGAPVSGVVKTLTFTFCNYKVTVQAKGYLVIDSSSPTGNGTLTSTGAKITLHTSVGICTFTTSGTDLGVLIGSASTKGRAVFEINSAKIPRTEGNFLCGSSGTWTGGYRVESVEKLDAH